MDGQNGLNLYTSEMLRSFIKKIMVRKLPDVALFLIDEIADQIAKEIEVNMELTNDAKGT